MEDFFEEIYFVFIYDCGLEGETNQRFHDEGDCENYLQHEKKRLVDVLLLDVVRVFPAKFYFI